MYPISYIQYGSIPIRDSPALPMLWPSAEGPGEGHAWGGVGGNPLCVSFHIGYRMLDIGLYIENYANRSIHQTAS